jgi:actin-related protein
VAGYKTEVFDGKKVNSLDFISKIKENALDEKVIDGKTGAINSNAKTIFKKAVDAIRKDYTEQGIRNVRRAFISAPIELEEHLRTNKSLLQEILTENQIRPKFVPEFDAIGGYFDSPNALLIDADDTTRFYVKLNNEITTNLTAECAGYQVYMNRKEEERSRAISSKTKKIGLLAKDLAEMHNHKFVLEFRTAINQKRSYSGVELTIEQKKQIIHYFWTKNRKDFLQAIRNAMEKEKIESLDRVMHDIEKLADELWEKDQQKDINLFLNEFREDGQQTSMGFNDSFIQEVQKIIGLGTNPAKVLNEEIFGDSAGLPKTASDLIKSIDISLRKEVAENTMIFGKLTKIPGFKELINAKLYRGLNYGKTVIIDDEHLKLKGLLKYLSTRGEK